MIIYQEKVKSQKKKLEKLNMYHKGEYLDCQKLKSFILLQETEKRGSTAAAAYTTKAAAGK